MVVSFWNHPIGKYIGKLKRKIKIWITYFLRQRDRENLWISHYMWAGQWAIETNGPVREFTQKAVMRLAEWRRQPWRHQVLADLITMAKYPLEDPYPEKVAFKSAGRKGRWGETPARYHLKFKCISVESRTYVPGGKNWGNSTMESEKLQKHTNFWESEMCAGLETFPQCWWRYHLNTVSSGNYTDPTVFNTCWNEHQQTAQENSPYSSVRIKQINKTSIQKYKKNIQKKKKNWPNFPIDK